MIHVEIYFFLYIMQNILTNIIFLN